MTNLNNLTEFLGHSILSKDLLNFIENLNLIDIGEPFLDYGKRIIWVYKSDDTQGLSLTFQGFKRFKPEFGEPKSIIKIQNDELILIEITINEKFFGSKISKKVVVPFDLKFGDDKEIVIKKLNKKPIEKRPNNYGFAWWFQFDDFRLLVALNDSYKLIWVRIFKATLDEIEKVKLQKELTQQNKNINTANTNDILNYLENLPTIHWRKRKEEGDEIFTDKSILDTEIILKNYLLTLVELTKQKKAVTIYNSVKKVVSSINKINVKNKNFIETMEREELCDFINVVVRKTGLEIEEKIDLTEQWREW